MSEYRKNGFNALNELITGDSPNSTVQLPPKKLGEIFSGITPEIIEAVEENEFDEAKEIVEWSKRNLDIPEESAKEELQLLWRSGIIGYPEEMGDCDEGIITRKDQPIQVQGDVILSVGFSREAEHIAGLPVNREKEEKDWLELQYVEYVSEDKDELMKLEVIRVDEEDDLEDYIEDMDKRENLGISDSDVEELIDSGKLEKPRYNLKVIK